MTQNLQPQDIQKALDEYVKRKTSELDKEITALTEDNRKEISSIVKKHAERVVYNIEHPPPKISLWSKLKNSFKKPNKESEPDSEI